MVPESVRRLLVVKTSSMGDVVHTLPAVSDLLQARPDMEVHWLVEKAFAPIASMHGGVHKVWPMAWRRWRKRLWNAGVWQEMKELCHALQACRFDAVIDFQGLLKSALWARQAHAPVWGYNRASAREGAASWFYHQSFAVPKNAHAVWRSRSLMACAMNLPTPSAAPDFGLRPLESYESSTAWKVAAPYGVLIPGASRAEKFWPAAHWQLVRQWMLEQGLHCVILWGREPELELARAIASQVPEVLIPPFLSVADMGPLLAGSQFTVGLDTGFTHLSAALGVPTLGIYCDHEPGLAGVTGPAWVQSLGAKGVTPSLEDAMILMQKGWQASGGAQRVSSLKAG